MLSNRVCSLCFVLSWCRCVPARPRVQTFCLVFSFRAHSPVAVLLPVSRLLEASRPDQVSPHLRAMRREWSGTRQPPDGSVPGSVPAALCCLPPCERPSALAGTPRKSPSVVRPLSHLGKPISAHEGGQPDQKFKGKKRT